MMTDDEQTSIFGEFDDSDVEEERRGFRSRTGTTRRQWIFLAAGFVGLAACVLIAVIAIRASFGGDVEGNPVPWREAVADANSVTVTWDASPCAKQGTVSVQESDDTVEIVVREVPRQALCSSPGEVRTTSIELDEPLGERELVDGSVE